MWMRECRARSGIVNGDEALITFIPGLDFIPSDVHLKDACRVCRYVMSVASIPIHNRCSGPQAISQKHSRRLCERHSALHREQTESHPQGGARHPPCSLPLRWIVHLSGAVWTQLGEWAAALASWRLTIWPGKGDKGNTLRLCEAKQASSTLGNRMCSSSGCSFYFRKCRPAGLLTIASTLMSPCAWIV